MAWIEAIIESIRGRRQTRLLISVMWISMMRNSRGGELASASAMARVWISSRNNSGGLHRGTADDCGLPSLPGLYRGVAPSPFLHNLWNHQVSVKFSPRYVVQKDLGIKVSETKELYPIFSGMKPQ